MCFLFFSLQTARYSIVSLNLQYDLTDTPENLEITLGSSDKASIIKYLEVVPQH